MSEHKFVHVVLLPSAGVGHLAPFLRLAASLTTHGVQVTVITPHPTVSLAESQTLSHFFTSFPKITQKHLNLLPVDHKQSSNADDPFFHHIQVIRQSSSLLLPLLSSLSPPASALVTDMSLVAAVIPITQVLNLPNYVFFTSSAKMLALFLSYHTIFGSKHTSDLGRSEVIKIPGLEPIPKSWIPPPLLQDKDNLFKISFFEDGKKMTDSSGILVNTSEGFEQETLRKLKEGEVVEGLPTVLAVGPLPPCNLGRCVPLAWLEGQPARSVVYVSFGSRMGMSREQIREVGDGLVRSGSRFIWVVKEKRVDVEDDEDLDQVLGDELMDRVRMKGQVLRWSNQVDILSSPAVGAFVSHCGWNSVIEAFWYGVPILAWPQHGDQKINAEIVERIGIGTWEKSWGCGGELLVNGAKIAERIRYVMENEAFKLQGMRIRDEARKGEGVCGDWNRGLIALCDMLKA
ncbi:hypothetical protein K2173_014044 [Erythroxylum novogranatense]|uniref:Glycosyltransferase n=1 Tax=Erythroxylum novogranatense TaxID=1862640 RepID=A0AAV8SDB8_9ROSI|nr:hypothetical protein K2173_014044 [Erythroxylum novogranatense]